MCLITIIKCFNNQNLTFVLKLYFRFSFVKTVSNWTGVSVSSNSADPDQIALSEAI